MHIKRLWHRVRLINVNIIMFISAFISQHQNCIPSPSPQIKQTCPLIPWKSRCLGPITLASAKSLLEKQNLSPHTRFTEKQPALEQGHLDTYYNLRTTGLIIHHLLAISILPSPELPSPWLSCKNLIHLSHLTKGTVLWIESEASTTYL